MPHGPSISPILAGQVPGFIVEGMDLPADHPQHPARKTAIFFKAAKHFAKQLSKQKPRRQSGGMKHRGKNIVADQVMHTAKGIP
jgi:hypothetical protein